MNQSINTDSKNSKEPQQKYINTDSKNSKEPQQKLFDHDLTFAPPQINKR